MFKKNNIIIPFLIIFPLIILYFFNLGDSILLGGEGNYFLNYKNYNNNFFSMWSHWGLGHNQFFLNGINSLTLLFGIIDNPKIISILIFFLLYVFPFVLFYIFTSLVSNNILTRIIATVFYSFNPFTLSFVGQMNIWNNSVIFLIPIYLIIIFKFYNNSYILLPLLVLSFFLLNLIGNPPIFVILIIIINIFYIYNSIIFKTSIKKILLIIFLINLFYALANLHILFPFIFADNSFGSLYNLSDARGWLTSSTMNLDYLLEIFIGTHHYGDKNYDNLSRYYNFPLIKFVIISYSIYIFYCAYKIRYKIIVKYLIFIYFFFFFITKGTLIPGGFIYSFAFENIPFFSIFKTPTEKFSIVIFTVLPLIILNVFSSDYYNNNFLIKISIPITLLFPIYFGFLFSNHNSVGNEVSRIYPDYSNDLEIIKYIDSNFDNSVILHLPGHYNYQSWKKNINNNFSYSGMDPILHSLKNNNYIDLSLNKDLYATLSRNDFETFFYLCSIYNVELIYINKKQYFPFGSILKPYNVDKLIKNENIIKVFDNYDVEIYQILNISNDFLIRSINNYSKVHVAIF